MRRLALCIALTCGLVACGPRPADEARESGSAPSVSYGDDVEAGAESGDDALEAVNPVLLAAPNTVFNPIEPSEVGVFAAPTVMQALDALIGPQAFEDDAAVSVTVREDGEHTIADVVRENIPDDSVAAGHVRIEFRREPEGWFPTNAWRRSMCRRGPAANQWSAELCP